jgi:hypothetical protein
MNASVKMYAAGLICLLISCSVGVSAQEKLEPISKMEIGKNREVRINGKPFFPIMSWLQAPENFPMIRACGINTFCGDQQGVTALGQCRAARDAGGYAVAHFDEKAAGDPYLLAWIQGDEPDMPQRKKDDQNTASAGEKPARPLFAPKTPVEKVADVFQSIKRADTARPVMMTLTGHFTAELSGNRYTAEQQRTYYPEFLTYCDITGFDIYPIYGNNYPKWLNYPASGVSQLVRLAGGKKPVYAWIETCKGSRWVAYEKQLDVLPKHTRFEVWGAIIEGATAIGYFTHRWQPDFKEFAPTEEMRAELKRLNGQVTKLAPAILANPARAAVTMTVTGGLPGHVKATELDGNLYIFAQITDLGEGADKLAQGQDISPRGGFALFRAPGLAEGAVIEVVDEGRTIKASRDSFTDDFHPLSEHIYRIGLK